jgi:hypothetical protein
MRTQSTPVLCPDPSDGRPRSVWDAAWEAANRAKVPPGSRAVPVDGTLALVTRDSLYAHDRALPGRPLLFGLSEASAIKDAYWTGRAGLRELARAHGTTVRTIGRLVHGKIMWYA